MGGENSILTGVLGEGRLDSAVAAALPQLSRARVQALLAENALSVDGAPVIDGSTKKFAGKAFSLAVPAARADKAEPQNIALEIVYEDDHLLVVDKPAGLVVHPAAGHPDGTLVNALLHHCRGRLSGIGGVQRPGSFTVSTAIRRGCSLSPRRTRRMKAWPNCSPTHDIERRYFAVVSGIPAPPAGSVRTQIGRSTTNRKKMAVLPDNKGKHAVTHFKTEERFKSTALVSCTLETGRTHQVRVHMAHIGHPLIGDSVYSNRQKPLQNSDQISPNSTDRRCTRLHWGLFIRLPAKNCVSKAVYQMICRIC